MKSMAIPEPGLRPARSAASLGSIAALATYSMWGLFPLYWKRLSGVEPWQVLAHRIVWSALFTLALLAISGRLGDLLALFRERKRLLAAAVASLLVTTNWGTYIWAVNNGHVTESALGYYINPLLSVALGAIFLREKLDRFTAAAVGIAALGVIAASVMLGSPPWIALTLAVTFGSYGLVKKKAGLDPVTGLAAEALVLTPFALLFLGLRHVSGQGSLGGADQVANAMLVLSGVVTAVPLLTFAYATNRITLQRLGFFQYVSPTGQLLLGLLLYREHLTPALIVAFSTVIIAVLIYATTRRRAS
jgi:chloramphenicol-sensitive protein RarD